MIHALVVFVGAGAVGMAPRCEVGNGALGRNDGGAGAEGIDFRDWDRAVRPTPGGRGYIGLEGSSVNCTEFETCGGEILPEITGPESNANHIPRQLLIGVPTMATYLILKPRQQRTQVWVLAHNRMLF